MGEEDRTEEASGKKRQKQHSGSSHGSEGKQRLWMFNCSDVFMCVCVMLFLFQFSVILSSRHLLLQE